MKRKATIALAAAIAVAVAFFGRNSTAQDPALSRMMKEKLQHAQKVLEGLAIEDYEEIAQNADALNVLGQAAAWRVLQTPEYLQHSSDFQRITKELSERAEEKNLDGAALSYVQLTINCVACHKHVRSVRTAGVDGEVLR